MRNIYLTNIDMEDVLQQYIALIDNSIIKTTSVDIRQALGLVTSEPVFAKVSSPSYNAAAMDGIAVVSAKTYSATENNPVTLEIDKDFQYVNTGNLIDERFDAVIMIEDVIASDEHTVKIIDSAAPWQHIRPVGEDIVAGEMLLPENHEIRPADIGAAIGSGNVNINVYERIKIGIVPTGAEIIDNYSKVEKGKIFDTNSWTIKALAEQSGAIVNRISPVDDNLELLKSHVKEIAQNNDIVLIIAGSSAGSKDFTSKVIEQLGEVFVHGIAIKPGKPTVLGFINKKPVIGLPGYPCSTYVVFEEIVIPIIHKLQKNINVESQNIVKATISRRIVSSLKHREYIRVKLGKVFDKLIATPLNRGAGVMTTLVRADGVLVIPKSSEGIEAGQPVNVTLISNMNKINNTIVSIGSHDLIIDILGSILAKKYGYFISSAHTGSMGGIVAIRKKETHIAPTHLLDEATGIYNEKFLPENAVLIKGVKRLQGIITQKGNPKNINSIKDIAKDGVTFINRQKGSGTRVLTDFLLEKENISTENIVGYNREMTTHMAVAAAVESGIADATVGVYSAAATLSLNFVEIGHEDYDFAVLKDFLNTDMIQAFISVLQSIEFKAELEKLGGYLI